MNTMEDLREPVEAGVYSRRIRVLLYHRILPEKAKGKEGHRVIDVKRFRQHLLMLERWGYTPITFNDLTLIQHGHLDRPRKPIIITFDDGYLDTYEIAYPILEEFGMRTVIFAVADPGTATNSWDHDLGLPAAQLMNERQLLELHAAGFEIGSHSMTHPRLPLLPKGKAWEEILQSRMRLEIVLNAPVHSFAYPYGLFNETLKQMVAEAGYNFAVGAWNGHTDITRYPLEIGRVQLSETNHLSPFVFQVLSPYRVYRSVLSKKKEVVPSQGQAKHISQMKTVLMVSAGLGWPEPHELARMEAEDERPHILELPKALNADILDERFLRVNSRSRSLVYGLMPVNIAQVLEAFTIRNRYDAIICWAERLGLPLAALLKISGSHTPLVAIFSWISTPKKAILLRLVQSHIDRFILMSSLQRDFALRRLGIPPSKIVSLRWPVDHHFWRPMSSKADMVCAVGREMRDYRTLIEAVSDTNIRCHIAGGGQIGVEKPDKWVQTISKLESLPPHITVGSLNYSELRGLYAQSRFMVMPLLPTDTDNGTTSILEAMAMGKAVICSRVKGQRDIIQEGKTGLLVPAQDPRALRDAVEYLWTYPEIADRMGREGRAYIEKYHTIDQWIIDVKKVVEETIIEKSFQTRAAKRSDDADTNSTQLWSSGHTGESAVNNLSQNVRVDQNNDLRMSPVPLSSLKAVEEPGLLRTITLVAAGAPLPEPAELTRRETADEFPRFGIFSKSLNSDILDERFLHFAPRRRASVYASMPVSAAQVFEAFVLRNEYDAILSWAEHLGLPLAALLKLTNSRIPHIGLFSWISKPKKAILLKYVSSHIDRLILWSSVQRDFAIHKLKIHPSKIAFTRWAVDQKFWRPMDCDSDMICSAGREMRDYETLVMALKGLNIRCHIAARPYPGKQDAWIQGLQEVRPLPQHVTVGPKNPVELRHLYAHSRFVVIPLLPSDTDNGITCILEAMAMGKAVICSRTQGQVDVIKEGKTGIFVPQGDPVALRKAIQYLWGNPEIAYEMGQEGRKYIEEHHTLEQFVSSVKSVVEEAVAEKSPRSLVRDMAVM